MERRRRAGSVGDVFRLFMRGFPCPAPPVPRGRPSCRARCSRCSWPSPACGGSSSGDQRRRDAASVRRRSFPVTVTGDNGKLTLDAAAREASCRCRRPPPRCSSPSAPATRSRPSTAPRTTPTDAPTTDLSAFTPNAEAIATYNPDLVVLSDDMNGIVDALGALKVPDAAARRREDPRRQLRAARDPRRGDRARRRGRRASSPTCRTGSRRPSPPCRPTREGPEGLPRARPDLLLRGEQHVHRQHLHDVRPEEHRRRRPDAAGGYPQLSAEYVVGQAPDLIVLADTELLPADRRDARQAPGVRHRARRQERPGRSRPNDDIASRWGPRVADFAESVADDAAGLSSTRHDGDGGDPARRTAPVAPRGAAGRPGAGARRRGLALVAALLAGVCGRRPPAAARRRRRHPARPAARPSASTCPAG